MTEIAKIFKVDNANGQIDYLHSIVMMMLGAISKDIDLLINPLVKGVKLFEANNPCITEKSISFFGLLLRKALFPKRYNREKLKVHYNNASAWTQEFVKDNKEISIKLIPFLFKVLFSHRRNYDIGKNLAALKETNPLMGRVLTIFYHLQGLPMIKNNYNKPFSAFRPAERESIVGEVGALLEVTSKLAREQKKFAFYTKKLVKRNASVSFILTIFYSGLTLLMMTCRVY